MSPGERVSPEHLLQMPHRYVHPRARQETTTAGKAKEQGWDADAETRSLVAVTAQAPEEAPGVPQPQNPSTSHEQPCLWAPTANTSPTGRGRKRRLGEMGQDALGEVSYPISANGQQLISTVITGNISTPLEGPALHSPGCCLPSGCFAASRAFGRGVCRAHGGLAGCKRKCWPRLSSLSR